MANTKPFEFSGFINDVQTDNFVANEITVKVGFTCYCYDDHPRKTEYYHIQGGTEQQIVKQLGQRGLTLDCNHRFIEVIEKVGPNYELWRGS